MIRIVFLDIDGVLAHTSSDDALDPRCIAELDRLLDVTQPRVVLTSAWRERYGLHGTQHRLAAAGFRGHVTEKAPTLATATRTDEIDTYLAALPSPAQFVILDDVPIDRRLRDRQVLVDDFVGLTAADVDLAIRMLT